MKQEKAKVPQKKVVCLGTGLYAEIEQHTNKEMPKCYPERIINMDENVLGLMDCHSKYFVATPENQAKLEAKIKACRAWCYVHILPQGRVRD